MKKLIAAGTALLLLHGCHPAPAATMPNPAPLAGCDSAIAYSDENRGLSVLVIADGQIVCESGGDSTLTGNELWSGTKSFVGVMAAAAVQDGLLALDERASETLNEWRDDPQKRDITLRQVLSMTNGQPSEIGRPPSYAAAVEVPLTAAPGETFQYGPVPMQLFGEIMRRKLIAAGQDGNPQAYLDRRILQPLGITGYEWRSGSDGNPLMPQGAILSAREWARFGSFILEDASLDGRPLVDEQAFSAMFKGSEANPAYGLTWWLAKPTSSGDAVTALSDIQANLDRLPADLVYAAGAGDQRLYIIPSRNMVIVRQARLDIQALIASGGKSDWSDTHFLELLLETGSL